MTDSEHEMPGPEQMFDFLDDDSPRHPYGRNPAKRRADAPEPVLPVIRAPVPVRVSGPLRAPPADGPFELDAPYDTGGRRVDIQAKMRPGARVRTRHETPDAAAGRASGASGAERARHPFASDDPLDLGEAPGTRRAPASNVTPFQRPETAEHQFGSGTYGSRRPAAHRSASRSAARPAPTQAYRPHAAARAKALRQFEDFDNDFTVAKGDLPVHEDIDWRGATLDDRLAEQPPPGDRAGVTRHRRTARRIGLAGGVMLLLSGVGLAVWQYRDEAGPVAERIASLVAGLAADLGIAPGGDDGPGSGADPESDRGRSADVLARSVDLESVAGVPDGQTPVGADGSVAERFRNRLEQIETLLADGQIEEAGRNVASLDRTVYGYGSLEFSAIEQRIAQWESTGTLPPAPVTSDVAATAAAASADAEQALVAAQQAEDAERVAEAERVAAAERAADEAAEEAAEAERVAAAERAAEEAAEAERVAAAERAAEAAAEAERVAAAERAAEEAARAAEAEQADRIAAAERAAAAERRADADRVADSQEAESPEQRVVDARAATDRQIAADRATARREAIAGQAEQDRALAAERAARDRAAAERAAAARAEASAEQLALADVPPVAPDTRVISDADLSAVYRRFAALESSIEAGDINGVTQLTLASGRRVQQFLQLFENSRSIDARITDVSTSRLSGSISGTLRIRSIVRRDGTVVDPTPDLASITLTSRRQGEDWSRIEW